MKKMALAVLVLMMLSGCNKGNQINGTSLKTTFRSVKALKERLPPEKRIEFEVAFGLIRDQFKDEKAFLQQVDAKQPEQIIEIGKELFQANKRRQPDVYAKFATWETMISQFVSERGQQDQKQQEDPHEKTTAKDPNVMYKL